MLIYWKNRAYMANPFRHSPVYTYIFWYHHLWNPHILATFPHLHRGVAAAVEDLTGVKLLDGHRGRPVARLTPNFPKNLKQELAIAMLHVSCFNGGYLPLTMNYYELINIFKICPLFFL